MTQQQKQAPSAPQLPKVAKPKILAGGNLKESDYLVRRYTARIPVSHTLADVEKPGYFQFYTDQLAKARGHGPVKLEVISDDCSIHAEYLVLEATRGGVNLRRLVVYHDASQLPELSGAEGDTSEAEVLEFTKNWSNRQKYRILQHGEIVAANVQSKEMADELLNRLNDGTLSIGEIPSEYRDLKPA